MLFRKKSVPGKKESGEEVPVDFPWLRYIGMNKLGFTSSQAGHLYFGEWIDLFEAFKIQHNFEMRRTLYKVEQEEEISSLDVL